MPHSFLTSAPVKCSGLNKDLKNTNDNKILATANATQ